MYQLCQKFKVTVAVGGSRVGNLLQELIPVYNVMHMQNQIWCAAGNNQILLDVFTITQPVSSRVGHQYGMYITITLNLSADRWAPTIVLFVLTRPQMTKSTKGAGRL